MNSRTRVAIVIPAYNEGATIADLAARCLQQQAHLIVVDDASTDDTASRLHGLPLTLLRNACNLGKGASLRRGIGHACSLGVSAIITLDGDGQHRPEDIPRLLAAHAEQPDAIVIAARLRQRAAAPRLRRFANAQADFWISWAAGRALRDSQSGFRLYPASLFQSRAPRSEGFVFESELLIEACWRSVPIVDIPIDTLYHAQARASHYRPTADTLHIIRMVAGRLLCRRLHLQGLIRSLTEPQHAAPAEPEGRGRRRVGATPSSRLSAED
ncbi:MAG: glycosyltransferase family 2 protein [Burkholderiaceae bacterium]